MLIRFGDALGLRVVSSEDFAAIRKTIFEIVRTVQNAGSPKDLEDILIKLDSIGILLEGWNPPGR